MKIEKVNIALAGFGNIGSYFYRILDRNKKDISIKTGKIPFIKYISAKNINKKRNIKIPKNKWIKNPLSLVFMGDVDIVVELIGGAEGTAKKLVFSALRNSKHVITANKALISKYGDELAYIAEKNNVNLEYEASVAGGIPIIRSIKEDLISNKINKGDKISRNNVRVVRPNFGLHPKFYKKILGKRVNRTLAKGTRFKLSFISRKRD